MSSRCDICNEADPKKEIMFRFENFFYCKECLPADVFIESVTVEKDKIMWKFKKNHKDAYYEIKGFFLNGASFEEWLAFLETLNKGQLNLFGNVVCDTLYERAKIHHKTTPEYKQKKSKERLHSLLQVQRFIPSITEEEFLEACSDNRLNYRITGEFRDISHMFSWIQDGEL